MSDTELARQIKKCQQGDKNAFSWLLSEFGPRLYRYFLRVSGSQANAEDLLQDLFVRLLEKIGSYRHEYKFEHWLFQVAANMARDRARKLSRHKPAMSLYSQDDDQQLADQIESEEKEPLQLLQDRHQIDQLQEALTQLPEQDREILLLRHYSQLSFKEIADYYDVPVSTALVRVHRGLKKLRKIMEKNEVSK